VCISSINPITNPNPVYSHNQSRDNIPTKSHNNWIRQSSNINVLSQQSERLQCWYYWWEGFMKYVAEMASGGTIYIPSFMTTGPSIKVILSLLPQQSERLQCSHYWWEGLPECAIELGSGGMIYESSSMMISSSIQVILRLLPQQFERLQSCYYWWEGFISMPLRWLHVAWYAYQVSWQLVQVFKQY
jgi:hypothetical protein